jgi:hypothetical protein
MMTVKNHLKRGLRVHPPARPGQGRRRAGQTWDRACVPPGEGVVSWPDVRTALAAAGLAAGVAGLRPLMETSSVSAINGR